MDHLLKTDKKFLWHPFTQQREWEKEVNEKPLLIARGKGVYLYDANGKKYIDSVSSLWANLHGHRNPILDSAVKNQLKKIAHSTFLGLTHEPGIRLAQELIRLAPKGLARVFFSDNGSTSVEVALKMAFQYHAQNDRGAALKSETSHPKTEFLALKNSYHGDTIGAVSVGGIGLFHKKFGPLLFKTHFTMSPHCLRCPFRKIPNSKFKVQNYNYSGERPRPGDFRQETGCRWECLREVETILKKKGKKIAAAVVEPIVQGAGGIVVMPPGYLWGFARLCKRYGTLLIADEVAVGFGRTGTMFACQQEKVSPDFLCLAKGITAGYLPLAATLTIEKIYRRFLGKHEEFRTFFHGHTYTANPLACAVSRANLKIFVQNRVLKQVSKLKKSFTALLTGLSDLPIVGQVRQAGLIAGIELVRNRKTMRPFPVGWRVGKKICLAARKNGILIRPLGEVIVLMPPLSISKQELARLLSGLTATIQKIALRQKWS